MSDEVTEGQQAVPEQQQNEPPAWMAQLPDDLKNNEELTKYQNFGEVAKDFLSTKKSLEETKQSLEKKIDIPGEDGDWDAFYNALGRPENPDGYELDGSGLFENEDLVKAFKTFAHQAGFTPEQAKQAQDFSQKLVSAALGEKKQEKQGEYANAEKALKEEWGDEFSSNLELTKRAINRFGGDELKQHLVSRGMDNDPVMIKMFHEVGKALKEDSFVEGGIGTAKKDRNKGTPIFTYSSMTA